MSLEKYNQKRDFEKTAEPKPGKTKAAKSLSFVVQRHHASHLHYDFRLEIDGVLKSWAIPKGPSLNPKDKRLAMMVEDHPYDYKNFEGEIPKGNYGAGTVFIFDKGNYQSLAKSRKDDVVQLREGLKSGNLKFKLKGKILKGEFALVKLKNSEQNAWLLIKHSDEFAVQAKFDTENLIPNAIKIAGKQFKKEPKELKNRIQQKKTEKINHNNEDFKPMLATLSEHIFDSKDWLFERKLDGYRIISSVGKTVSLITRNGKDYTDKYKIIAKSLSEISDNAILDGEIIALDRNSKDNFQSLQHYENEDKNVDLKYYVFDLLYLNNNDLRALPLIQRKELLKTLLKKYKLPDVIYNEHVIEKGKSFFEKVKKYKWEGAIAKRIYDEYFSGKRTDSWLKFKINNSQEAIICGFTKPSGNRKYFGALVLGIYDDSNKLKYIGNCGTGFNDKYLKVIHEKIFALKTEDKPFNNKVNQEKNVTWIKPEIVCELVYTEWTNDGHLRHPVFKSLRDDKLSEAAKEEKHTLMKDKTTDSEIIRKIGNKEVKLTNLDKLYWKKENITKGDLISYYESVSESILPYLKNKPLSLNRHPSGIEGPSFYQKDMDTDQIPEWAKTVKVYSENNDKIIDYLVCNDLASLLYMVNLGCIEVNPWLSNYQKPENPEFMVIDLDPDGNSFHEVAEVALVVKDVYDKMNIVSYIKTSGSSGLHIYVYIASVYDYDFVKKFAEFIAQKVHEKLPDLTSLERNISKRKNKIYIDYLQNRRGQTIVAPYSVRPKPHATVSYPLDWSEINADLDMRNYHIKNVPQLIKTKKNAWKNIKIEKNDLKKVLKSLGE